MTGVSNITRAESAVRTNKNIIFINFKSLLHRQSFPLIKTNSVVNKTTMALKPYEYLYEICILYLIINGSQSSRINPRLSTTIKNKIIKTNFFFF